VAVVSAFEGVTNRLLAEASTLGESGDAGATVDPGTADSAALAVLLSTGEIASAAHLALALHRAGVPTQVVDPRDIELTAGGDRSNAELLSVRVERLNALLNATPVVVIPGFFARGSDGGLVLLGRGGSDLTALYLAAELCASCVLLKDVDGLYEADPATAAMRPRRFSHADYSAAETYGGALVQPKAICFARDRTLNLELAQVGCSRRTGIGEGPSILGSTSTDERVRIALLGLGTVGGGVLDYLRLFPDRFEVVAALVRTPEKYVARGIPATMLVTSPDEVFARDPAVVVEALPGIEPARRCLKTALKAGIRVVTANKALLAADWDSLASRLVGPTRQIRYAAAVGGAVPMLEMVERVRLRNPILRLRGVLNGTCNFVLGRCARGVPFAQALQSAQELGFAEQDPTADLSGLDAARKIEILGRVAFGGHPKCQYVRGIIDSSGRTVDDPHQTRSVLIAEAQRTDTGFEFKVAPCVLAADEFLAGACGAENRLEITASDGATVRLQGLGAGRLPTATAVFADVLEHALVIDSKEFGVVPLPVERAPRIARAC